jgi:uroporphyrin-3 C-methyltransferase
MSSATTTENVPQQGLGQLAPQASRWRKWLPNLSLVLALIAVLLAWQLWQKVSTMQEMLARQSADAGQLSMQANSMAKSAQEQTQETAARVALLDARLSEVALQRSQLEELMQSLSRSRDENLVVDIESALGLAQQQADLTGSVQPMLSALLAAQKRLSKLPQPRMSPVLRAIQHDIDRLQSASLTDVPGVLIRLDELVLLVETLPAVNAVGPSRRAAQSLDKASARSWSQIWADKDWAAVGQRMWSEVTGLVRVSRIEEPESVLLSPEQSFFARENLKLRLLNARLSLLARQTITARNDLTMAERDMNQFFDLANRPGQTAKALMKQVQGQIRLADLPRLDGTMAALATASAGR